MNNTFAFYSIRSINIDGCLWLSVEDLHALYGKKFDLDVPDAKDVQKWQVPDPEKEGGSLEFRLISLDGLASLQCRREDAFSADLNFCNYDNSEPNDQPDMCEETNCAVEKTTDDKQAREQAEHAEAVQQEPEEIKTEDPVKEENVSHGLVVTDAAMIRRFREVQEMDSMKEKVHAYLNKTLPSDWQRLSAEERIAYLDDPTSSGRLVRDRVILEEIILECLRRPQDMANLSLQNTLTSIMDSFPEWQYVRSVKPYKPYNRGMGYKRVY